MSQINLDLIHAVRLRRDHGACQYRFMKDALVEEIVGIQHIYGLWDKLFGCWITSAETQTPREIIPYWVQCSDKQLLKTTSKRKRRVRASRWHTDAESAFSEYMEHIPLELRQLVAPFRGYQWLVLDFIWQCKEFSCFLESERRNGTMQFMFACIVMAHALTLSREKRRHLAEAMLTENRCDLLGKLSNRLVPRWAIGMLHKLGDKPCDEEVYKSIFGLCIDGQFMKALAHSDYIDPNGMLFLEDFPKNIMFPNIVRIFTSGFSNGADIDKLASEYKAKIFDLAQLYCAAPQSMCDALVNSFGSLKNPEQLCVAIDNWNTRLREVINFPPPPFSDCGPLQPISNPRALVREGKTMQNCVADYLNEILDEQAYFYHWEGNESATVMLGWEEDSGWYFSEAFGPKNTPLSEHTWDQLIDAVTRMETSDYTEEESEETSFDRNRPSPKELYANFRLRQHVPGIG